MAFRSGLTPDEVRAVIEADREVYRAVPGLLQMFYWEEASTGERGGLLLFATEAHLQAYLDSELRKSVGDKWRIEGGATRRRLHVTAALEGAARTAAGPDRAPRPA